MDPIQNPYAPGAGTQPPELAGRQQLREDARVALQRTKMGRPSKSLLVIGLRGVGKTVLIDRICEDAQADGVRELRIEASEDRSLPSILAPQLRLALLKLSNKEATKALAQRAMRGLAGFVNSIKITFPDIGVALDIDPEPGLADSGDMEADLQDLFGIVGEAARSDDSCVVLFVDELQYVEENQLAALITALHRTAQRRLPIIMIGAGLPQVRGRMGKAKSYAERLCDFSEIGPLSPEDAHLAIAKPARDQGVEIESSALDAVVEHTRCYPYFLQEWGKHMWDVAERSPITVADVETASQHATADLDESFFRVRFDRLTPEEKRYLRAMAQLGAGPHRSGAIARAMGRRVNSVAPTRSQLIDKGMIWSPSHGDTAFTVPTFDEFMLRIMPRSERQ